jgi:hypothetical protein
MAIVNGYCTLQEIKAQIGLDAPDVVDDDELERVVTSASRWIDQHCRRHFWQTTTQARVFDICSCGCLEVELGPFNDLHEVTSIKTDDNADGAFETTWAAGDYQLLPLNPAAAPERHPYESIRAIAAKTFPTPSSRTGLVEVTGKWGWEAVPADVKEACLIASHRLFKRRNSPEGVTGWQSEFGAIRLSTRTDPDVASLLAPYRHPAAVALVA